MKRLLFYALCFFWVLGLYGQSRILPKSDKKQTVSARTDKEIPVAEPKDEPIPANLSQREKNIIIIRNLERRGEYTKAAELALEVGEDFKKDRIVKRTTEFLEKAIELAKKAKNKAIAADAFFSLAENYLTYDLYDDATKAFRNAARFYEELGQNDKLVSTYLRAGDCFFEQREFEKAAREYEKAFKAAPEKDFSKVKAAKLIIKSYKEAGTPQKADSYEQYINSLAEKKTTQKTDQPEVKAQILQQEAALIESQKDLEAQRQALENLSLSREEREKKEAELQAKAQKVKELERQLSESRENLLNAERYNKELSEAKSLIEQKSAEFRRQVFFVAIIAAIVMFAFGVFIITIRRANQQIKLKNKELSIMNDEIQERNRIIEEEKRKSDELLLNILPASIADELKEKGYVTPKHYDMVSVLFTDFKGFTAISEKMTPTELISELNTYFSQFDAIIKDHNLEKIKTIGDAYMCAGGLPEPNQTNAVDAILAGLKMVEYVKRQAEIRKAEGRPYFDIRVGIHTGPLVAGVVGTKKFIYDIWGDTVNTASRMESSGEPGRVNVSGVTQALADGYFNFTYRGKISAKNKEPMDMYFVDGLKDSL